jgi:ribosomal protein S18 acetylase RimI-like enzyme
MGVVLDGYFNYVTRVMESWWERRDFVHGWRRLNRRDARWTPPYHPALTAALTPGRWAHMARLSPVLIQVEAMPGKPRRDGGWAQRGLDGAFMEQVVAASVILADPRRRDRTAYLGLLSVANDVESLERLMTASLEQAWASGCKRLMGPVGLSPQLGYGALEDHFHLTPPLYTPYQPPYVPDVLRAVLEPVQTRRFYVAAVNTAANTAATAGAGPAQLRTLSSAEMPAVLPPLLAALDGDDFPPPDAAEAAFLLEWWGALPLAAIVAEVAETPVGCLILQPDLAAALRGAGGARTLWGKAWLAWRRVQRTHAGRALAWCVLPGYRGRGIGRQLWQAGMAFAREQGWSVVGIGPVAEEGVAAAILARIGARPRQRYTLYATEE